MKEYGCENIKERKLERTLQRYYESSKVEEMGEEPAQGAQAPYTTVRRAVKIQRELAYEYQGRTS